MRSAADADLHDATLQRPERQAALCADPDRGAEEFLPGDRVVARDDLATRDLQGPGCHQGERPAALGGMQVVAVHPDFDILILEYRRRGHLPDPRPPLLLGLEVGVAVRLPILALVGVHHPDPHGTGLARPGHDHLDVFPDGVDRPDISRGVLEEDLDTLLERMASDDDRCSLGIHRPAIRRDLGDEGRVVVPEPFGEHTLCPVRVLDPDVHQPCCTACGGLRGDGRGVHHAGRPGPGSRPRAGWRPE